MPLNIFSVQQLCFQIKTMQEDPAFTRFTEHKQPENVKELILCSQRCQELRIETVKLVNLLDQQEESGKEDWLEKLKQQRHKVYLSINAVYVFLDTLPCSYQPCDSYCVNRQSNTTHKQYLPPALSSTLFVAMLAFLSQQSGTVKPRQLPLVLASCSAAYFLARQASSAERKEKVTFELLQLEPLVDNLKKQSKLLNEIGKQLNIPATL